MTDANTAQNPSTATATSGDTAGLTPVRAAEREEVLAKAQKAREVSQRPALTTTQKNDLLLAAADRLVAETDSVLEANGRDIDAGRERGMSESLIDR
ncbi:MAG: gamma-glutamyl-phosphate reductase, partial [Corynebacterium sp.]|nr:gamma-glutamyl-phosphate reductase [Corynebacterium sp.]